MKRGTGARLGQHFLTGLWAARALARAAGVMPGETVLEIGPGKGALTRELLLVSKKVIAIEKDEELVLRLRETFAAEIASGALTIVAADIRDITPEKLNLAAGKYVLAANIPYYITGEIVRQFLTATRQPRAMALLVQKEVADRIVSARESILSLSVKAYGRPRIVKKVPRGNFSPPPSVDSAILLVDGISRDFFAGISEDTFFKVVRAGFASKRKYLANNLGASFGRENAVAALSACGIPKKVRAENTPLGQWKCLAQGIGDRE